MTEEIAGARRQLASLSESCGVISGELRAALERLFEALIPRGRVPDDGEITAAYGNLVTVLYQESSRLPDLGGVSADIERQLIDRLLVDDHLFLQQCACASGESPDLRRVMSTDLAALQHLARVDLRRWVGSTPADETVDQVCGDAELPERPWNISHDAEMLKRRFRKSDNWPSLIDALAEFVRRHGCGSFQATPAFHAASAGGVLHLEAVADFAAFDLEWLEGNQHRIDIVDRNTRNLIAGFEAHNILVWGPRGCGKSSLIRGLVTRYYEAGLRAIEVRPEHWDSLRQLYSLVRGRREFFIAVLDNISVHRDDPRVRDLSSVLDGALERQPRNLVFYGTSNFKDLVDRDGLRPQGFAPHSLGISSQEGNGSEGSGTVARPLVHDPQQFERLDGVRALDDRFALKVFMDLPTKAEYEQMVISYARRAGIETSGDELIAAFHVWRMKHNHDLAGGRTARAFILDVYPDLASPSLPLESRQITGNATC